MAHLTFSRLCLLGLLISSFFLGARSSRECARGWMKYERNCYSYFDEQVPWSAAESECQSFGPKTHLASVLSKFETNLIAKHISTYKKSPSNVWIGLHDVQENGRWRWIDGAISSWKSWNVNEPNKIRGTCAQLSECSEWKKWETESCEKQNAYICKYEM